MGYIASFLYSQFFVTPQPPSQSFAHQYIIVTGSNVGLGLEAARHFARLDAQKVILAVRNVAAGESAKQSIEESTGRANVCDVWPLDLECYASVRAFAKRASTELPRIDVLLENAGIATRQFGLAEGHERTVTVNVISTFLLGLLLLPKLRDSAHHQGGEVSRKPPRWIIVSSLVHQFTDLPESKSPNTFEALDDEKTADMSMRYAASKLLEVLVVRELAPKLKGSGVILNVLNPGLCHSALDREGRWIFWLEKLLLARSTEVGSRTLVAAAAVGDESHGAYMTDGEVNNAALSPFVTSEASKETQMKVWVELQEILENIAPGVTKDL